MLLQCARVICHRPRLMWRECSNFCCAVLPSFCPAFISYLKVWTNLSVAPFEEWWYGQHRRTRTCVFSTDMLYAIIVHGLSEVNCGPLSDTICSGKPLAPFPGSHSRKGEESLLTLRGLNHGLPPPGFWRNQSDCRTKTHEHGTIL